MKTLSEWLEEELMKRSWKPADLTYKARIGSGTLSNILSGTRNPGPDVCQAIAHALGEPPEKIFRLAGLLPPLPGPEDDAIVKEMVDVVRRLTPNEREEILEYARWRYRRQQEQRGPAAGGDSQGGRNVQITATVDATASIKNNS